MKLFHRIAENIRQDRRTLKALTFRQKIRFFMDYYRWLFLLFLICLLFLYYIGDMIYQSRQTIDLQGFFINDRQNLFPAGTLADRFSDYQNTQPGHRIAFDDSLFIDLDSSSEYDAASQSKLIAFVAAKELDFLVAPESLARRYARSFSLLDLSQVLPEDLKEDLKEDFYIAADGTGVKKACGLDLSRSQFLQDSPVYDHGESYYLLALSYTPHRDALISFIRFAYQQPPESGRSPR